MCVLARDEWRKNNRHYSGLCSVFFHVIHQAKYVKTDDEVFNYLLFDFLYPHVCNGFITVRDLIPQFQRPADADPESAHWWPKVEKEKRYIFLQDLVTYYANLIDHEQDEK